MLCGNASNLTNGPSSRAVWIALQDCTGVTSTDALAWRTGVGTSDILILNRQRRAYSDVEVLLACTD